MPMLGYLKLIVSRPHALGGKAVRVRWGGEEAEQGGSRDPQQQRIDAAVALQQTVQPRLWRVALVPCVERGVEGVHLRRHYVALRPGVQRATSL